MTLPTKAFGRTGCRVTRLGFGAMELMAEGADSRAADPERLLGAVLDAGITLIDTAPDYGASETWIGRALAHRRDEYFLASKCGCLVDRTPRLENGKLEHDFRPENVRAGVEQSLRRMKTDRLDLVQIHSSPSRARIEQEDTIETLETLRREGKVRFLGMSSTLPDLLDHLAMGVFDAFQIPYSALQPEHEAVITQAAEAGAATIIRGGVARGATAPDHDDAEQHAYWKTFVAERRSLWERAGLDAWLATRLDGMPRMEFMLRFVLSHPGLDTTIVGTANPQHLASNVAMAAKGPLPSDVVREAQAMIAKATAQSPAEPT